MFIIRIKQFGGKEFDLVDKLKKVVSRSVQQEVDKILGQHDSHFGNALKRNRQLLLLIELGEAAVQDGSGTQMGDQGGQ